MTKYAFHELVDVDKLRELMDRFYAATGIPVGIIDIEGQILVATGWQDICTLFHRVHPGTLARCRQSDAYILDNLHAGGYVEYKCKNGLWDLALPLVIAGEHMATLFLGQFFYADEVPDTDYFRNQAKEFGFDEDSYIAALGRIPVFTREKVKNAMEYYTSFVQFLMETGFANLKRIQSEKALRYNKELMQTLFQASPDNIIVTKLGSEEIFDVNEKFLVTFGYSRKGLIGSTIGALKLWVSGEEREMFSALMKRTGQCENFEARFSAKNGTCVPVLISAQLVVMEGEGLIISICHDITERKRIEAALIASEERYRNIFEQSADAIAIIDPETTKFVEFNTLAHARLGYTREEFAELSLSDIIVGFSQEKFAETVRVLEEKGSAIFEIKDRTKSGEIRDVLVSVRRQELNSRMMNHCVVKDITDLKKMQEELVKAQKLDSLGILAGGIAHDFNNILTGIQGNLSIIQMLHPSDNKTRERIDKCENAVQQATGLTRQLLTFSRGGAPVKKIISLRHVIEDSVSFALRGSNVVGNVEVADDLRPIEADEGQISQVINNLLINADQAMPDGGSVRIEALNCRIEDDQIPSLAKGEYVRISVTDQGCGIPPEHLDRIFDPYFTTKKTGTGLGLTSVYWIVRKHGGHVQVASNTGKGARFDVYLPACPEHLPDEDVSSVTFVSGEGEGFVLVMDDEQIIRDVAEEMLSLFGYRAETCSDGEELIALYRRAMERGEKPDAIIMDLTIPGKMGGLEAASRILAIDPSAKLIVSSGYSNDPVLANHRKYGFVASLVKPFRVEDLGNTLSRLMEKS